MYFKFAWRGVVSEWMVRMDGMGEEGVARWK